MVVLLKYLLLIAVLTPCIQAINLNFFGVPSRKSNQTARTKLPIRTILTTTSSVTKTTSINVSDKLEMLNSATTSPVGTTTHTISEKLELEDELPEVTTEANKCVNLTNLNKTSGQEIDESNECPTTTNNSTTTSSTTSAPGLEIDETKKNLKQFPLGSFIPTIPKITFPVPALLLPKQKTITITQTLIKSFTQYHIEHPSCLKLESVTGVCSGNLITIMPTPAVRSESPTTRSLGHKYEVEEQSYEVEEPSNENEDDDNDSAANSSTTDELSTTFSDEKPKQPHYEEQMLETSELDFDFEEVSIPESKTGSSAKSSTPPLNSVRVDESKLGQSTPIIESLLSKEPKIEYVKEYVTSVTIQTSTDRAVTATVIASRCVPRNLNLPICTQFPAIPVFPFLHRGNEIE